MMEDEDYDVVVDVLSKHKDALWRMTQANMRSELGMGMMDDIRLSQIDDITQCINLWKAHKNGNTKTNQSKA